MKKLFLMLMLLAAWLLAACGIDSSSASSEGASASANVAPGFTAPDPNRPVGLLTDNSEVEDGYVLVSVIQSKDVILLSNDGQVVNMWAGDSYPRLSAYLLENGNLVRAASVDNTYGFTPVGQWSFIGGRIEELTWDGEVVWSFEYASEDHIPHHDFTIMPNGHILMVVFERFTEDEARAAGKSAAAKRSLGRDDY